MKKTIPAAQQPAVLADAQQRGASPAMALGTAQLHASPRMALQRQQLESAFGTTQFAGLKKKPMQHKADTAQMKAAPKKKLGR